MKKEQVSSCKQVKHRSLTGLLRRNGVINNLYLQSILDNCDVDSHVGELPLELRRVIPKQKLSQVTKAVFYQLDKLVSEKYIDLINRKEELYILEEISNLFGLTCVLETADITVFDDVSVYSEWCGATSDVFKISFPEIYASYALKVYKPTVRCHGHGPLFEIPTAFCASHAEPKYNNQVYMAKLTDNPYMLSKWLWNNGRLPIVSRQRAIYRTDVAERKVDNYCKGKLIDFGRTYKTYYGLSSYNARKYYRKMQQMTQEQKENFIKTLKTQQEKADYKMAQLIFTRSVLSKDYYCRCE